MEVKRSQKEIRGVFVWILPRRQHRIRSCKRHVIGRFFSLVPPFTIHLSNMLITLTGHIVKLISVSHL
jgi:hypothetical protein